MQKFLEMNKDNNTTLKLMINSKSNANNLWKIVPKSEKVIK